MSKRGSERQMTKNDWDDDNDGSNDAGFGQGIQRASEDVLRQRRIVRAQRPPIAPPPSASSATAATAATAAAANPFARVNLLQPSAGTNPPSFGMPAPRGSLGGTTTSSSSTVPTRTATNWLGTATEQFETFRNGVLNLDRTAPDRILGQLVMDYIRQSERTIATWAQEQPTPVPERRSTTTTSTSALPPPPPAAAAAPVAALPAPAAPRFAAVAATASAAPPASLPPPTTTTFGGFASVPSTSRPLPPVSFAASNPPPEEDDGVVDAEADESAKIPEDADPEWDDVEAYEPVKFYRKKNMDDVFQPVGTGKLRLQTMKANSAKARMVMRDAVVGRLLINMALINANYTHTMSKTNGKEMGQIMFHGTNAATVAASTSDVEMFAIKARPPLSIPLHAKLEELKPVRDA